MNLHLSLRWSERRGTEGVRVLGRRKHVLRLMVRRTGRHSEWVWVHRDGRVGVRVRVLQMGRDMRHDRVGVQQDRRVGVHRDRRVGRGRRECVHRHGCGDVWGRRAWRRGVPVLDGVVRVCCVRVRVWVEGRAVLMSRWWRP